MFRSSSFLRVRVLALTMTPNGGFIAPALERLGYKPYTFESSFRRGNASTHPPEWSSILEGKKRFDPKFLGNQVDAIVGPPAAIAFDKVLHGCPQFTKVILVIEDDKDQWSRDVEQYVTPLLVMTLKTSKRSIGMHFHNMIQMMLPSDKKLGRVAALEMFEERVKRTVPSDRLLVYHYGDGWAPLCEFLGKETPKEDEVPFPRTEDGFECCNHLENRIRRASKMTTYVSIACGIVTLIACWPMVRNLGGVFQEYYKDYKMAFSSELDAVTKEGREEDMTLRRAMVLSKKVTMEFEDKLKERTMDVLSGGGVGGKKEEKP